MRNCAALLPALLATIALGVVADAQNTSSAPKSGRLVGVYDERTGSPIEGASVLDTRSGYSVLTTSTGTVILSFVDSAGGVLEIRKIGYKPLSRFVENRAGLAPLTLTLVPAAQVLPLVTATDSAPVYRSPALREFESRRREGHGHFIPEAIVRRDEGRTLGNLIKARIVGLDVREMRDENNPRKFVTVAMTTRGGKQCPVDVFLDGILISAPTTAGGGSSLPVFSTAQTGRPPLAPPVAAKEGPTGFNDLAQFDLRNLAAVEFYTPSTVPAQFNRTSSGCGTLLLWSRER